MSTLTPWVPERPTVRSPHQSSANPGPLADLPPELPDPSDEDDDRADREPDDVGNPLDLPESYPNALPGPVHLPGLPFDALFGDIPADEDVNNLSASDFSSDDGLIPLKPDPLPDPMIDGEAGDEGEVPAAVLFWRVIAKDGRYAPEAYLFLQEALSLTVRRVHGEVADGDPPVSSPDEAERDPKDDPRHVTGRQLCEGARDLALMRWGRLARTVLERWGICSTRDFGEMVFVLVSAKLLAKTEGDRIEDFDNVFPLGSLERDYRIDCETLAEGPSVYSASL